MRTDTGQEICDVAKYDSASLGVYIVSQDNHGTVAANGHMAVIFMEYSDLRYIFCS